MEKLQPYDMESSIDILFLEIVDLIGDHLELTPFYYIAHYSGTNQPFGGADRSFQGTSGNFIDNDFVIMRGQKSIMDLVNGSVLQPLTLSLMVLIEKFQPCYWRIEM